MLYLLLPEKKPQRLGRMLDFLSVHKDLEFSFLPLNKQHIAIQLLEQALTLSLHIRARIFPQNTLFDLEQTVYGQEEEVFKLNRTTALFESAEGEGLMRHTMSFEDQNAFIDGSFGKENKYVKTLKAKLSVCD